MTETLSDSDHIHVWVFAYTREDWFLGDEEDVYECASLGCPATRIEYVPR